MWRLPSEWIAGIPTEVAIRSALVRVARISARGISIATAKTSVNAGRHRKTYRQEPGHKGALEVRLRKLAIDGGKTLQGVAEFAYQQSFQVWCFQRLSTALTGPPEPISRSTA